MMPPITTALVQEKSPSKNLVISPSRGPALKVRPPSFRAKPCIPSSGLPLHPFLRVFPLRFLFRALPCGGYPQTPSQALPATVSSYPTLSYRKRGLRTTLQTSRQSLAGGLIDSGQKPPSVKGFLYGSQSLCPFGASHGLFTSLLSPPLGKGLNERSHQTPQKPHAERSSKDRLR